MATLQDRSAPRVPIDEVLLADRLLEDELVRLAVDEPLYEAATRGRSARVARLRCDSSLDRGYSAAICAGPSRDTFAHLPPMPA